MGHRENKVWKEIAEATSENKAGKKMVVAGVGGVTLMKRKKEEGDVGSNGEGKIMGVAARHSYMINGVTTRKVTFGGKTITQKFVEVHNPWQSNYIRLYDKETLRPFNRKKQDRMGQSTTIRECS